MAVYRLDEKILLLMVFSKVSYKTVTVPHPSPPISCFTFLKNVIANIPKTKLTHPSEKLNNLWTCWPIGCLKLHSLNGAAAVHTKFKMFDVSLRARRGENIRARLTVTLLETGAVASCFCQKWTFIRKVSQTVCSRSLSSVSVVTSGCLYKWVRMSQLVLQHVEVKERSFSPHN